jgi:poly-gamma-glutamate synthesis protein (capsule biosynthesis protein)
MKVSYIPIIKNNNTIRIADEKKSKEIIDSFYKRSEEIKKKNFVENNWRKYCSALEADYLGHLIGLNRYLAKINKIFKNIFLNIYLDKNKKLKILNLIECEAHNEVLKTILKGKIKK